MSINLMLFIRGIDLIGPLPESDGKCYIATAVCYFTKSVEAKAIPDKSRLEIAQFIYELMSRYGVHTTLKQMVLIDLDDLYELDDLYIKYYKLLVS